EEVRAYLTAFAEKAQADELMVALSSPSEETQDRSMDILAEAWGLGGGAPADRV
ncbi:alkane 1-monooxygenase, partial [Corynebacterium bovis]